MGDAEAWPVGALEKRERGLQTIASMHQMGPTTANHNHSQSQPITITAEEIGDGPRM